LMDGFIKSPKDGLDGYYLMSKTSDTHPAPFATYRYFQNNKNYLSNKVKFKSKCSCSEEEELIGLYTNYLNGGVLDHRAQNFEIITNKNIDLKLVDYCILPHLYKDLMPHLSDKLQVDYGINIEYYKYNPMDNVRAWANSMQLRAKYILQNKLI